MAVLEEAVLCAFQQCVYYVSKVSPGGGMERGRGLSGNWEGRRTFPTRHPTPGFPSLSPGLLSLSHEPLGLTWGPAAWEGHGAAALEKAMWQVAWACVGCGGRSSALGRTAPAR